MRPLLASRLSFFGPYTYGLPLPMANSSWVVHLMQDAISERINQKRSGRFDTMGRPRNRPIPKKFDPVKSTPRGRGEEIVGWRVINLGRNGFRARFPTTVRSRAAAGGRFGAQKLDFFCLPNLNRRCQLKMRIEFFCVSRPDHREPECFRRVARPLSPLPSLRSFN